MKVKEKIKSFLDQSQKFQDNIEDGVAIKTSRIKAKWNKGENIAEEQEYNAFFVSIMFVLLAVALVYVRRGGLAQRLIYMGLAGICLTAALWSIANYFINSDKS